MTISLILPPSLKKRVHELFNEVAYIYSLGLAPPKGRGKILVS